MKRRILKKKSTALTRPRRTGSKNGAIDKQAILPNENLKKLPDEAYGDTKIPDQERKPD